MMIGETCDKTQPNLLLSEFKMAHPKLKRISDTITFYLKQPSHRPPIIAVFGPSGVGKTTMMMKVLSHINDYAKDTLKYPDHMIAAAYTEVVPAETVNFNWNIFYRRTLEPINKSAASSKKKDDYRRIVEHTFRERGVIIFVVDEAHDLGSVSTNRKIETQISIIKSLANWSDATIVLVGTYTLIDLFNKDAQLLRRSKLLHFDRYDCSKKDDIIEFENCIRTFLSMTEAKWEPHPEANIEYFYRNTLGCIGNLYTWIMDADLEAKSENSDKLTIKHLKKHEHSTYQIKNMLSSIKQGEGKLTVSDDEMQLLKVDLGIMSSNPNCKEAPSNFKGRSSIKPGQSKPERRAVGGAT